MLQVQNLSKSFQDHTLFEDVTFSINSGERVGFVGRNGSGKSTLFKMIQGIESEDSGKISFPNNYRIGSLDQYIKFDHKNVLDECMSILPSDQRLESYRAEKLLTGLGFEKEDFNKDPLSFSGGFQVRINLIKSLLKNPNLLLLDEPTNYLDIPSLRWLKSFLNNFDGEVFIITHDRDFMDSVCTHTLGLHRKSMKKIKGNTQQFYQKIAEEEEIFQKTQENKLAKKQHLESFIERFGAKASKATQAKSKLKQLEKLGDIEELDAIQEMSLNFNYAPIKSKILMEVNNLSFGYQSDNLLIKDLSFQINNGDKVGIIGKNGKGKSTLLNLLYGSLSPVSGQIKINDNCQIGHFGQTNVERLSSDATIIEEVISSNADLPISKSRALCGAMLFTDEMVMKKISVLSGGEKSRVLLAKIMAKPNNFLFLDEPTNHLDIQSIDVFKERLKAFEGALLLVTHSEEFLRSVVDKLIYFKNDKVVLFEGTYDEFLEKIGFDDEIKEEVVQKNKLTKKEIHKLRQEIIKRKSKECKPLENELKALESKMHELDETENKLKKELEELSKNMDDNELLKVSSKLGEVQNEIESLLDKSMQVEDDLNSLYEKYESELEEVEK